MDARRCHAAHPTGRPRDQVFLKLNRREMATLLFITLVILWWIAVWGLFDMAILHMTRFEKMIIYGVLIITIVMLLQAQPELMDHF
jgi:hypothetical protein